MSETNGILSGVRLTQLVRLGDIEIDPFNEEQVNPASYDLRLGRGVAVYDQWVMNLPSVSREHGISDDPPPCGAGFEAPHDLAPFDIKHEPKVHRYTIDESGWILKPGILYLMHTVERTRADAYVPVVDGKSSIGRLGIKVHETAGFGDPGFDGQWTLEVTTVHPIRIYAGMRIAQVRFHSIAGRVKPYEGNYLGDTARGAVPSRTYRQFK